MTHDPLCFEFKNNENDGFDHSLNSPFCYCELITRVREDQKRIDKQIFAKVSIDYYNEFMEDQDGKGYYEWFEMWLDQYKTTLTERLYQELS
jgi:hypothetical protein